MILKKIKDLWIPQSIIAAVLSAAAVMGASGYIEELLEQNRDMQGLAGAVTPLSWLTIAVIFGLLGYMVFDRSRCIKYREATGGRSLKKDKGKYPRDWYSLMDYFTGADPYRIDPSTLPEGKWYKTRGVILGKVGNKLVYRLSKDAGSVLVAGLPGDGKTTAIVIPTAAVFGGSCFVVDIKGDVLRGVRKIIKALGIKRKILVFNPSDLKSVHFDPFGGLEQMSPAEVEVMIDSMAHILIPDEESKESKFFVDGARSFFIGIFFFFYERGAVPPFMDFIKAMLTNGFEVWLKTIHDQGMEQSKKYLESYMGANEKNTGGQYNKLIESLRPLTLGALPSLLNDKGTCINAEMLQKGYDIYIELPQHLIKQYSSITTLISSSFMQSWMRQKDNTEKKPRPVLMILDEFAQMHFDADMITGALATLRSKGVTLMMIVQSIAQLEKNYGENNARTIMETCSYKCILSCGDPESMEYFSKLFGKKRVLKVSTTNADKSVTRSVNEAEEFVFKPEDFAALNAMGDGGKIAIQAKGKYILADKCFWFKDLRI